MAVDVSKEGLELLKSAAKTQYGEIIRSTTGSEVKFGVDGVTKNDPSSGRTTSDWQHGLKQLLAFGFIEESSPGIYKLTPIGYTYADNN